MRQVGRQQRQNATAKRQTDSRQKKLDQKRGLPQQPVSAALPIATQQPMLVYMDANGQQIIQPVAVVQQPGQAGAQVIPTGAAQKTKAPLFKASNRQQNQSNGNRRQSGGQQQQQQGQRRQQGRGNRRN